MASKKFLVNVDFATNEIQNAILQNLGSAPTSPKIGAFYYDTALGRFRYRGATAWIDPLDRQFHTGTQTVSTISDFASALAATSLSVFSAPTADLSVGGFKLTNVATGTNGSDAVNYGQLMDVQNGRDFKESVRVATTASIGAQSGLLTIDGVTLVAGDRVLDKDNADAKLRGIWVASTGAWTRAADANTSAKMTASMSTMVEEGTINQDRQYTLTTNGPIVLGTTNLAFAQTGASTTYTGGLGITVTGSVIAIDPTVVTRKVAADIGDGSATSYAITHGLGSVDVNVNLYDKSTGATVEADVVRTSATVVTVNFAVAPTANQYRAVIVG